MSERSVDDRCECGHYRDRHAVFAGACREDDCQCERFDCAPTEQREAS